MRLRFSIQQLLICLTGMVAAMALSLSSVLGQGDSDLTGAWLREEDEYRGWVIDMQQVGPGKYEAKSLWVPDLPRASHGFRIGEKKFRKFERRDDGNFYGELLSRDIDGNSTYSPGEVTLTDESRLIYIIDQPTGEIGDRQKWRRIQADEVWHAYVEYGRGELAVDRERWKEAKQAFARATNILCQRNQMAEHRSLANNLAWSLVTNKNADMRDPEQAMRLLPVLDDWYQTLDTAAAVHAANNDFETAIRLQKRALGEIESSDAGLIYLQRNGLDTQDFLFQIGVGLVVSELRTAYQKRLELYEERTPYHE